MHNIKYYILEQLLTHETRRFSQLRKPGVESNLFQYHLLKTIKDGYVEKTGDGYTLSPKGLQYADKHSNFLKSTREQAKIISIIVLTNKEGKVLVVPKLKQPYINTYHLPAGKVHPGERILASAYRELQEKTGITGVDLHEGDSVHSQIYKRDMMISEYFGFIVTGEYDGPCPDGTWYDPANPTQLALAGSVVEVIAAAHNPTGRLHELTLTQEPSNNL